jgi:hypothetical protein
MPTVSYSCPTSGKKMKKSFPYNAVGKAQAVEFAKMNKGNIKNNPGPYMETQTPKPEGENRPISDLGLTDKNLRKGGTIPVGGSGIKGAIKMAAKVIGKLRKK